MTRAGVVGHVEWVHFARVEALPEPGAIVHALDSWEDAAGGGGVAAVQLARLGGASTFLTALGTDDLGRRAAEQLGALGATVHAAAREGEPTRRAFTHTDAAGERTITVIGDRMVPVGADPLPWESLADLDAVYFTGGDAEAVRAARAARVLVATPRGAEALVEAGVKLDVLVHSGNDADEVAWAQSVSGLARYVVATAGGSGGRWTGLDETTGSWAAAELPGPVVDAYGCGDSFAAGLTFALGRGDGIDSALAFAARCGAACLSGRGPYGFDLATLTAA